MAGIRIRKNELVNNIIAPYMQEQGFELRTDKKTFWEWSKKVLDVVENVVICDKHNYLQLLFGNDIGSCAYVMGNELLHTIDRLRTQCE
ncbi:MAG: hypothetical protein IJX63_11225 [Lachnospiraceae bacterium]|nr:hypothetical protein [Lachnospiraceae bacterium]